jgi:hypothetical protein
MDDDTPTESQPPRPAKMSMTPSWVMLGFVLGAFFVWALPEAEKTPPSPQPAPVQRAPEQTMLAARLPRLTDVEAVFAQWDRYAIWDNDATEVAYWSEDTNSFSNFFEVLRMGDRLFFRSIPKLTRPLIKRGVEAHSPFLFTGVAEVSRPLSGWAAPAPMPDQPVDRPLPPKIVAPTPQPTTVPPPLDPALSPAQPTGR